MHRRPWTARAAVLLTAAALIAVAPISASAAPSVGSPPEDRLARSLTLITGDRVTVSGGRITVTPRPGVQVAQFDAAGHRYVVPSDALDLLQEDLLDQRLFDVTTLLDGNFDRRAELPLIVSDAARAAGLAATRALPAVDGLAGEVAVDELAARWATIKKTTGKIWLDGVRKPALDTSVGLTGAPAAWQQGFDGSGVTVAVLDSGVDDTHPDLAGRVAARKNFVPEWEGDADVNGHGTHVASIVGGSGAGSDGRYRGMAPGAALLDGKVCFDWFGQGACPESAILAGMQWAAEQGADVVNMSLGSPDSPGVDPLEAAVDELTAAYDTLFVIAAGNDGLPQSVGSPATADAALAVGAVTKEKVVDGYSSQGPRLGDYAVKPEITAPGSDITAARNGGGYVAHSGTSMAAPHVAGAAALLAQAQPSLGAAQLKSALVGSARPQDGFDEFAQGAGLVDVPHALSAPVSALPATVSFGFRAYPHDAGDVVTRTLTYRNTSAAPVTVELAVTGNAPAGLLTLTASTVTVPAQSAATVDMVVDTRQGGSSYGAFSGRVVATGDGVSVQTPFSVMREEPSADISLTAFDRSGAAPEGIMTMVASASSLMVHFGFAAQETIRVPLGEYFVAAMIPSPDGTSTSIVHPNLAVADDTAVALDARLAKKVDITVPARDAEPVVAAVQTRYEGTGQAVSATAYGADPATLFTADLSRTALPGLITHAGALFAGKSGTYQLGWSWTGRYGTGVTRHVRSRDLTTVPAGYALNTPGAVVRRANYPVIAGFPYPAGAELPELSLPARRAEHYAGNLTWESTVTEVLDGVRLAEFNGRAGVSERWNGSVLGVPLTPYFPEYPTVERRDDELLLRLTGYADSAGHLGYVDAAVEDYQVRLYRDGELVESREGPYQGIPLAPEKHRYRLDYTVSPAASRVSATMHTVWEFDSAPVATATALPLTAVGFAPRLDLGNTARVRDSVAIPLTFTQQAGAGAPQRVRVEASYNDGTTWSAAPVARIGSRWTAVVHHPSKPGFVSLRATVVNEAGSTVTQTVIRAYEIR
ncbi:S8 family serine peptidase [Actinoplanes sp. CA-015351]|uniref:S8 family serine peptidase n=1 Tax=Actinoplanes sp. CA-015351 TaxID=3239897 RepID=UPI003D97A5A0